jgi:predicted transcriptional regulator
LAATQQVKTYVDEALRRDLESLARAGERSLAAEVRRAIREYVLKRRQQLAASE